MTYNNQSDNTKYYKDKIITKKSKRSYYQSTKDKSGIVYSTLIEPLECINIELYIKKIPVHRDLYPPDASRGIEIPPAFITYHTLYPNISNSFFTNDGYQLINVPIVDATMPFNVMTLISTLIALIVHKSLPISST